MMDVSDGLLLDLCRLCAESAVGARIDVPSVPVAAELLELAGVLGVDPLELALSGGEDYELLATIDPAATDTARAKLHDRFGVPLTDVGEIVEHGFVAVDAERRERPIEPGGWDHFAPRG
jgi:thiamine-monophosphate kinase